MANPKQKKKQSNKKKQIQDKKDILKKQKGNIIIETHTKVIEDIHKKEEQRKNQKKSNPDKKEMTHMKSALNEWERRKDFVARNLLRIYQYIEMDKKFEDEELIRAIEVGTPNEQLKLEIESLESENQALKQNALQEQIYHEENVEISQAKINELKEKISTNEDYIKKELKIRSSKYEEIIHNLRDKLKKSLSRAEHFTEVSDEMRALQNQVTTTIEENQQLTKEITKLSDENEDSLTKITHLTDENEDLLIKCEDVQKKVHLQDQVIAGYKRRE